MRESAHRTTVILDLAARARCEAYCHERGFPMDTRVARPIRDQLDSEGHLLQRSLSPNKGILEWG